MSLLQDNSLEIEQNDEDLEEQKRIEEQISNILADGFEPYQDDESTLNSSVASTNEIRNDTGVKNKLRYEDSESTLNELAQNYKEANQHEQLRILYEVRMREVNKLRDELTALEEGKNNEIKVLKNKVTLSEAELRHLQVTLANSESLLVEKTENINNLQNSLALREQENHQLKQLVQEQNLEICTYQSTVNELQFKIAEISPLNAGTRKINSEELQRAHESQISKLESLLQEQTKKVLILEKEKLQVDEDLQKLIKSKQEAEAENDLTVLSLSKKLQSTQQQCKDLFVLGEAIKKECDHFKERMLQLESNEKLNLSGDKNLKKLDKDVLASHFEKLKRMLLDRDIEVNSLRAKLKFYESDVNELFEYRQLLSKLYSYEFKSCNNLEHEELIIFMQGQLQSYQQAVEDRNSQILTLNSVNKELQEKIEEMLEKTRTDIQNIAQKYSLPQLENMNKELQNAEETINNLKQELLEKGQDLLKKEEKVKIIEEDCKHLEEDYEKIKTQLQKICLQLGLSEAEIFGNGDSQSLRERFEQVCLQLKNILLHLEVTNTKKANFNIIFKLKKEVENCLHQKWDQEKLEEWDNMLIDFMESLKNSKDFVEMEEKRETLVKEAEKKNQMIDKLKQCLKIVEESKAEVEKQLENTQTQLHEATLETIKLRKDLNLILTKNDSEHTANMLDEKFQAELLKAEILLRESLQIENAVKMQKIEEQYKKVVEEKNEWWKNQVEKLKNQEITYRNQFAAAFEDCGKKMESLESENVALMKKMNALTQEHNTFRNNAVASSEKYNLMLATCKKTVEDLNKHWKSVLEFYMHNAAKIERQHQKSTKSVLKKIALSENELKVIENMYEEKIQRIQTDRKH